MIYQALSGFIGIKRELLGIIGIYWDLWVGVEFVEAGEEAAEGGPE